MAKQFCLAGHVSAEGHRIALQPGDVWLQALLQAFEGVSAEYIPKPHDHALLMFTGGTTGKPKAAISTHHGLLMTGMQLVAWMGNLAEPWHDKPCSICPCSTPTATLVY